MPKDTKTTERVLHELVREDADKFAKLYGSLKAVLSAGIIAFGKLSDQQRNELISEIQNIPTSKQNKNIPQTPRMTLKNLVKSAKKLKSDPITKIGPTNEKLWAELREIVGDYHEDQKRAKHG